MTDTKPKSSKPIYIFVLLGMTALYLLVECAFNARLLDVVSSNATPEVIGQVEFWGRIISGVAVALAICGTIVFPILHKRGAMCSGYFLMALLISTPTILIVYHAEKYLIDTLSNNSSEQERKTAALLALASGQLRQGDVSVHGVNLEGDILYSPEGKTFVALFSPLVSYLPNASQIIEEELDSLTRQAVNQKLGSVESFYHGPFAKSFPELQKAFIQYAAAVNTLREGTLKIPASAEQQWNNYVASIKRQRRTPSTIPRSYHQQVRRQVQSSGVPVPNNWNPSNKSGFIKAYIQATNQRLLEYVRSQFEQQGLPSDFPLNCASFDKFLLQSDIQTRWKEALKLPQNAKLANGMTIKDFEKQAFIPLQESLIEEKRNILISNASAFKDGGKWEAQGKDAVRALIVPAIALLLSLLGAFVHLCKTSFYVMRLMISSLRVVIALNICIFAILIIFPLYLQNSITNTDVYIYIEESTVEKHPYIAKSMRWVIHTQSYIYPINDWIRNNVLNGIQFGNIVKVDYVEKS